MTRPRPLLRSAAAALWAFSALAAAAAPGVPGGTGFDAAVLRRGGPEATHALEVSLREEAFRLWEAGGFGADRTERAAWVVRNPGGVVWRPWPWDRRYLESRWLGPTPAEAVAIVHTHPAVVDPRPSPTDRGTAQRLRVPVYTVSRSGIWKVEPDGVVSRVGDERWWDGCGTRNRCRESVSVRLAIATAENAAASETTARPLRITE